MFDSVDYNSRFYSRKRMDPLRAATMVVVVVDAWRAAIKEGFPDPRKGPRAKDQFGPTLHPSLALSISTLR